MWISVVLIIILFIVYLYTKFKRKFELSWKIPGPWFIPFLGNVQFILLNSERLFAKMLEYQKMYKETYRLWITTKLWVFLSNPNDVKEVLNNRELMRVEEFHFLYPLIGNGLLLSDGTYWAQHRKALSFAFNTNILNDFLPAMSRNADILASKFANDKSVEVTDHLLLCMLDTVCETFMGALINAQNDPNGAYVQAFHDASHILFLRMSNPLLQPDFLFRLTPMHKRVNKAIATLHSLTDNIIQGKRKKLNGFLTSSSALKSNRRQTLIDVLLLTEVDGKQLTDQEIKDHVTTFLFAGIDTTKSAVSFLLYNIARYQHIQEKLYQEITTLIGTDPGQEIHSSYLANLPYLENIMKESLRFHTTVPVSARRTTKEIKIGKYTYPKGCALWVNIYGVSHDPNIFKDPDKFKPERFDNPEWLEKYGEYAFIPHSAGPRYCIGKKYSIFVMKTIVIKLLLHYKIQLSYPEEELTLFSEMVLKSKTGINLNFSKRMTN